MKQVSRITICGGDSSREYPQRPLIGVAAIIIKGVSVVLIRRAKEPSMGEWSIPGGLVQVGETLSEAVIREAREETGLKVRQGPMVQLVERIITDPNDRVRYHYVIADYRCSLIEGELIAGSDACEACWALQESLEDYGLPALALEIINKAFEIDFA
jgi:8-oxo-dGTP diphosphatase